jgi:hypothetical protein
MRPAGPGSRRNRILGKAKETVDRIGSLDIEFALDSGET